MGRAGRAPVCALPLLEDRRLQGRLCGALASVHPGGGVDQGDGGHLLKDRFGVGAVRVAVWMRWSSLLMAAVVALRVKAAVHAPDPAPAATRLRLRLRLPFCPQRRRRGFCCPGCPCLSTDCKARRCGL